MYVQSEYEYYKHISFKNIKYYGLNKGSIRIYNRVTEILDQPSVPARANHYYLVHACIICNIFIW